MKHRTPPDPHHNFYNTMLIVLQCCRAWTLKIFEVSWGGKFGRVVHLLVYLLLSWANVGLFCLLSWSRSRLKLLAVCCSLELQTCVHSWDLIAVILYTNAVKGSKHVCSRRIQLRTSSGGPWHVLFFRIADLSHLTC